MHMQPDPFPPDEQAENPPEYYRQSGVIPYRRDPDGIRLLLITSRGRKRWVIPKGICEPHLSPAESAAAEAYEEAGIRGRTSVASVGSYTYSKWGGTCVVEVYLLQVEEVLAQWPESADRTREWVRPEEAASRVNEPALQALLREAPELVERQSV